MYVISHVKSTKISPAWPQTLLYLSCFYIWFGFMSAIPHKEERFLFVVYPHLCLAAAVAMHYIIQILRKISSSILKVSKVSLNITFQDLVY